MSASRNAPYGAPWRASGSGTVRCDRRLVHVNHPVRCRPPGESCERSRFRSRSARACRRGWGRVGPRYHTSRGEDLLRRRRPVLRTSGSSARPSRPPDPSPAASIAPPPRSSHESACPAPASPREARRRRRRCRRGSRPGRDGATRSDPHGSTPRGGPGRPGARPNPWTPLALPRTAGPSRPNPDPTPRAADADPVPRRPTRPAASERGKSLVPSVASAPRVGRPGGGWFFAVEAEGNRRGAQYS